MEKFSCVSRCAYVFDNGFDDQLKLGRDYEGDYFIENEKILSIPDAKVENLHIISDNILEMIQKGKNGWEKFVPNRVADAIKENHLFNYPYDIKVDDEDLV